jgi:hypothetical protein
MDVCFTPEDGDNVIAWEVKIIKLYWLYVVLIMAMHVEVN